jgi:5-bromo-4-chloroindolyl phosphate hydrolysis protein
LDTKVSDELDKMELILNKIFAYVEEHPESAGETAKLMKYYLPTTMNLLDSYRKLSTQPVQGENILKSIKEIEETIGTLNKAFERLFDNLYQDQSMDIASDISVLNSMLAQEGLTGEEMKQKEYV